VRLGALLLAGVLGALLFAATAHADGEAGLVVQNGDDVQVFCIPFSGDSITGDAMLQAAGVAVRQTSGGARAVCALDDVGCFPSDCFCECSGGSRCTYWAFFTKAYGNAWADSV